MAKKECPECHGQMITKAVKVEVKVGKHVTHDSGVKAPICSKCGHYELSQSQLEAIELKAAVVVLKDTIAVGGAELKFARKAIGLRQIDLAHALQVTPETICRMEKDEHISRTTQLAVAALVDLYTTDRKQLELLASAKQEAV